MSITAREAAFKALGAFRRDRIWPAETLGKLFGDSEDNRREVSLAAQITNGVLQNMAFCDFFISNISSVELSKLEPRILDILRLSVYQLIFLSKVPASAAVNEGVKLAKRNANQRAVSYVNAVLRKSADLISKGFMPDITGDISELLSIKYSHPQWLVNKFRELLDDAGVEMFLAENNSADSSVTVQVNTLRAGMDETLTILRKECEATPHEWLSDCIVLHRAGNITRLDAFVKGYIYAQDSASRLAVLAAGPAKGNTVVDGCAAPGGKSYASAILMENSGTIIAYDVSTEKISRISEGAARMGIGIIDTSCRDSSVYAEELAGTADIVLADVPCSGFGVIKKKPEIRYKTEQEIAGLPDVQKQILTTLSEYVKPGGVLLYSTCTVLRRENEDVVEWFLSRNNSFALADFELPGIGNIREGKITLWPHIHKTDGFFICKMERKK